MKNHLLFALALSITNAEKGLYLGDSFNQDSYNSNYGKIYSNCGTDCYNLWQSDRYP